MTIHRHLGGAAAVAALVMLAAGPASAGGIRVSSNGADSASCGSGAEAPCATIAQAVTNAVEGDTIAVGPGSYTGAIVNKSLSLTSSAGTGGAVITGPVELNASGIEFGKKGQGFGVTNLVTIQADEVVVRGNLFSDCTTAIELVSGNEVVVRDNSFDGCGTGISVLGGSAAQIRGNRFGYVTTGAVVLGAASTAAVVRENRTYGPSGTAFYIDGTDHLLWRNLVHGTPGGGFQSTGTPANVELRENVVVSTGAPAYYLSLGSGWVLNKNAAVNNNAPGFYLTAGTTLALTGNLAIGNSSMGILIQGGSDHVLTGNSMVQNGSEGIVLAGVGTGVVVTGGNIYGNGNVNCGINHSSASAADATGVYWGDPAGPGPDPADVVCGNIAALVVDSPAESPAKMKMPSIK